MSLAGKSAAAGLSLVLSMTGAMAGLAATPTTTATCTPGAMPAVDGLTPEQDGNAAVIVAIGRHLGVPDRGLLVALMVAAQESGLRNLDYGDRDSLGLFQQRPSQSWGTSAQVRDPAYAAAAFYGGPTSPAKPPGLLDIQDWQRLPLTSAAQAVQRSANPQAYARWETPARGWLSAVTASGSTTTALCDTVETYGSTSTQAEIAVAAAAKWLGTPYSWGGGSLNGPSRGIGRGAATIGFDCSGLTRYAWAQAGLLLPRTSREQWSAPGQRITRFEDLHVGDLVFFATNPANPASIHHVALWLGGGAMLEAPQTGDVVRIAHDVPSNAYWAPQFMGGLSLSAQMQVQ